MIGKCVKCKGVTRIYAKGHCDKCYAKIMYNKASPDVKKQISNGWRKKIGNEAYNEWQRGYYKRNAVKLRVYHLKRGKNEKNVAKAKTD